MAAYVLEEPTASRTEGAWAAETGAATAVDMVLW